MKPCPGEDDLLWFVDGALSVEQTEAFREHLEGCVRCREQEQSLRLLVDDIGADVPSVFDARAHARVVMDRLGQSTETTTINRTRFDRRLVAGVGAVAACGLVVLGFVLASQVGPTAAKWQARGGDSQTTVGRDVGVQLYAIQAGALHPLAPGAMIDPTTPLTAAFRNLGRVPVFLLLFAVDADRVVHWISPPYLREKDNPGSTPLVTTASEKVLEATVVLQDTPSGPLRLIAVITPTAAHVSDVEALEGSDLSTADLTRRFPSAEVRETLVHVFAGEGDAQ
jgi:hypothetical protein